MPRKKHQINYLEQQSLSSATASSLASSTRKPQKSVNELLANLRNTATAGGSSDIQAFPPATTPSVPPAIREILQIPETPAPPPRRPIRRRVDDDGRRLPPGPPPPRSWTSRRGGFQTYAEASTSPVSCKSLAEVSMPGTYLPERGSLIHVVLQHLSGSWEFYRVYEQYHLYHIPSYIKSALMRSIGIVTKNGLTAGDLKLLLLPSQPGNPEDGEVAGHVVNQEITTIDLSGSLGKSINLKQLSELLFPASAEPFGEPQDAWDGEEVPSGVPRTLLPKLTHLSLALNPEFAQSVSWKQLLRIAPKIASITHLSLAFWPDPCLTRRAQFASVSLPQGKSIPLAGTNYYSHSLDHDWSEALLVLRLLSQSLYELEFLDLTGCFPWFKALLLEEGHDYVDWSECWGKIRLLRLCTGWNIEEVEALPSRQLAHREACQTAAAIERRIIAMRAGTGSFITVERD